MEQQPTGIFTTKEDEEMFNSWTKEDIYKAYLVEVEARRKLNIDLNRLNTKLAAIRYAVS